jgi:hypothetical protein
MRQIDDILLFRDDISPFIVHLTLGSRYHRPSRVIERTATRRHRYDPECGRSGRQPSEIGEVALHGMRVS